MLKERLDRIIEIKEKLLDDKEREIEEEGVKLAAVGEKIRNVDSDIEKNYDKMSSRTLNGNDFSVIRDYLEYLENTKYALEQDQAAVQERIEALKEEMIELMQETKMFDKLRTKAVSVLRKSLNRREQKLLDDIALRIEDNRC